MLGNRRLIQALDHFAQETGNQEALGGLCRYATGTEIKHLVFVDLSRRGAVRTTDVIRQNFKAGH
ncbi:MAG TPA: hypothetical protein VGF13_04345 [Verrucomicrobiae bacterium]